MTSGGNGGPSSSLLSVMCTLLAGLFPPRAFCAAGVSGARPFPPAPVTQAGAPRDPLRVPHTPRCTGSGAAGCRSARCGWHAGAFLADVDVEGASARLGAAGAGQEGFEEGSVVASLSSARG